MAVTGLNHYNITTPLALLPEVRDFYCEVIGLEQGIKPPSGSPGFWLYAGGNPILHLSSDEQGHTKTGISTIDHVAFTCTGLDATLTKLDQLKIAYSFERRQGDGPQQIFFKDILGNGVELNFRQA